MGFNSGFKGLIFNSSQVCFFFHKHSRMNPKAKENSSLWIVLPYVSAYICRPGTFYFDRLLTKRAWTPRNLTSFCGFI